MALGGSLVGAALHSNSDASVYTYASATYSNNQLYLLYTCSSIATGTAPSVTSVTGGGLTWVEVTAAGGLPYSGTVRRIQVFRALVTSGAGPGALTINLNGTSTQMDAIVMEMTGMDTSGTNGSGAIVQTATATGVANELIITLGSFGNSNNRPVAGIGYRANTTGTQEAGYTLIQTAGHNLPIGGSIVFWHVATAELTPSASGWGAVENGGIAIEIKAAAEEPTMPYNPWLSRGPITAQ